MVNAAVTWKDYMENDITDLPEDFSIQKAVTWVDLCINTFQKKYLPRRSLQLLATIIKTYNTSQEFKNSVFNKVQKIIQMCITTYSNVDVASSLDCLEILLLKYGNACFLCKAKISAYLERFLCSSLDIDIISKSGSALHFLQQVGAAGKNGAIHKKQWLDYVQILCQSMHPLYDAFFANIKEYSTHTQIQSISPFDYALQAHLDDTKQLAQKLRNITVFLKCALVRQYSTERSIPFLSIFYAIKRGLMVDEFSDDTSQTSEFLHLLYTSQINLLHLLKTVIVCGTPGIRKYSEEILKLLTDCLKRTDKSYFQDKRMYEITLHAVLNEYICLEKENLSNSVCDIILSHNLKHILNVKKSKNNNTIGEVPPKKVDIQLTVASNTLSIRNMKCKEAIRTVISLLRNCVLINEDKLDVLYKFTTGHLLEIRNGRSIVPYASYTVELYELLNVLREFSNYCSLPLLNFTVEMYNNDWQNKNHTILIQGVEAIENLVNPMYPSLATVRPHSDRNLGEDSGSRGTDSILNLLQSVSYTNTELNINIQNDNEEESVIDDPPVKRSRYIDSETINDTPPVNKIVVISDIRLTDNNRCEALASSKRPVEDFPDDLPTVTQTTDTLCEGDSPVIPVHDIKDEVTSELDLQIDVKSEGLNTSIEDATEDEFQLRDMFHDIPNEEFLNL